MEGTSETMRFGGVGKKGVVILNAEFRMQTEE
jgi:hypothetical protein